MPSGNSITDSVADSMPVMVASARVVGEYEGGMPHLVERHRLGKGMGLSWKEISMEKLDAQPITETTRLNNAQQIVDTPFTVTPSQIGIHTVISNKMLENMSQLAAAQIGGLAMNAIVRKMDLDGLAMLDGASIELGAAGDTLQTGDLANAVARVSNGGGNEPGHPPYRIVLHSYQAHGMWDEIINANSATGDMGGQFAADVNARVFQESFKGMVHGGQIFINDLISIDSGDDAKGGAFAKRGLVLVEGMGLRTYTRFEPDLGGGSTSLWIYHEYAYGERSSGNWVAELLGDATAPS